LLALEAEHLRLLGVGGRGHPALLVVSRGGGRRMSRAAQRTRPHRGGDGGARGRKWS
jgi:hypothetical protein